MHPPRRVVSQSAFLDKTFDVTQGQFGFARIPPGNLLSQLPQTGNSRAYFFSTAPPLRNYPGDGFVMASNDNHLPIGDTVQEFAEARFGIES
jgi:hypothetical protein